MSGSVGAGGGGGRPADPSYVSYPGPNATRFREIRRFAELDSTNRYLLDEARGGAPEGLVVVADHQTAGRGRLGRRWEAPPGTNLLVSVLVRPALPPDEIHLVTTVAALAAADGCAEVCGVTPALKWPNDLMVGDRKLAGVLAEVDGGHAGVGDRVVVVGIGLNVGWPVEAPPAPVAVGDDRDELERITAIATSLRREAGWRCEPADVLERLLMSLESRLGDLVTPAGRSRQAAEYRSRCATLGRPVHVERPGEAPLEGTAADITAQGHLVVEGPSGPVTVSAGDVVHLRPTP